MRRIDAIGGDAPGGAVPRWEHFEHGADVGVRGVAGTVAGAFEQAALALTAVVADPNGIAARRCVDIVCSAADDELLLVDWLNALVYEMADRQMLFATFRVAIREHRLTGRACGEALDVLRHEPVVEVKGATYTALEVREADGVWCAQCVVDV